MSRNDLCACGSGKRFKHCHGRLEAAPPDALHADALAAHRAGELARAEALYRQALERNPGDAASLHMLGIVQFERLRYRDALELLWRAAESTQWSDANIRRSLGLVLAKLLSPQANARQKDFVAAYVAQERERKAGTPLVARVSVVLPVHDRSRFVARAIASVARQTFGDVELIVVDDGATGEAARAIADCVRSSAFPVKVVQGEHRDEARAANAGAERAAGRYLAFLDADDWFAPNRLERMVAEMARAAPLWGYSRVGHAGGEPPASDAADPASPPRDFRNEDLASFALLRRDASESSGNLFIDRKLFQEIGGYADAGEHRGWDMCVRVAKIVEPVVLDETLYFRASGDGHRSAASAAQASERFAAALVADALGGNSGASNSFCPQFAGNRELLLRAELRAGRGDHLPVPMLRSLAAEWRERPAASTATARGAAAPPTARRTALVILGVYRSGTSALARVLNLCGAYLPPSVLAGDLRLNPKGFWETEAVNDLDARLLRHLGADWRQVDFALPRSGPLVDEFLASSRELLATEYGDAPLVLIKDPRVCVLAPLWHRSLGECGYRCTYVVAVRNPLEVARSFTSHDRMPIADGLALWLAYMERVASFVDAGEADVAHVRYTDLLDDWRGVVQRVGRRLDVPLAIDGHAQEVDGFLDAQMRKHRATQVELESHLAGASGDAVRSLYRRLLDRCDRDAAAAKTAE